MAALDSTPSATPSVTIAGLVITAERLVLTRSGALVTSVRRDTIRSIRAVFASASEQPMREGFWALVLIAVGGVWAARSLAGDERKLETAIALVLLGIGIWTFTHVFRRVPQLQVQGAGSHFAIVLSRGVTQADLVALEEKLTELDYPVI